jgi:hypothetical protein
MRSQSGAGAAPFVVLVGVFRSLMVDNPYILMGLRGRFLTKRYKQEIYHPLDGRSKREQRRLGVGFRSGTFLL